MKSLRRPSCEFGLWRGYVPIARASSRMTITDGSPWSFERAIASSCVVNRLRIAKERRLDPTDSPPVLRTDTWRFRRASARIQPQAKWHAVGCCEELGCDTYVAKNHPMLLASGCQHDPEIVEA